MTLQWVGPMLAAVTVGTIWFGHVMVRRVNYRYGTKPAPFVFFLGLLVMVFSVITESDLLSGAAGIVGITTMWDAYELVRQEERVRLGRAPRNPNREVEPKRSQSE